MLQEISRIAELAGEAIMKIYQEDSAIVENKADNTPLTQADRLAHEIIKKKLKALGPGLPLQSEEDVVPFEKRRAWQEYWLIDPLDGTKEFLKRNGEFTVNIALIRDKCPVLGVVHAPVLKKTWSAAAGKGAFLMNEPLQIKPFEGENIRGIESHSHRSVKVAQFFEANKVTDVVRAGSSLKFCMLAENGADVYPRLSPTSEWDIAAGHLILKEAGGKVIDLVTLLEPEYNKESLLNNNFIALGGIELKSLRGL